MKNHALFVIFEKAVKFLIVFCCKLYVALKGLKNSFRNTLRVSNGLDPYQDQHSVSPDLGPNCLQRRKIVNLKTDDNKTMKTTQHA